MGSNISMYIFPLIAISFLLRTIGTEEFGLMQIILSFNAYFVSIILYGQILSGTNEIAQNSSDLEFVNHKFYTVILSRLVLFTIIAIIIIALLTIPWFYANITLYLIGLILILGNAFQLDWFYNGLQEMKYNALFTIVPKIFFLGAIFLFVKKGDNCTIALLVHCLGYLVSGICSFAWAIHKYKLNFHFEYLSIKNINFELKENFKVFLSTFVVNFYSVNNVFILSFFVDKLMVGYYSVAVKIYAALKGLSIPLNQAILPRLSQLYSRSSYSFSRYLKYCTFSILGVFCVGCVILYFLSPYLLELYTGKDLSIIKPTITVLNIFIFALVVSPLSGLYTGVMVIVNQKNNLLKTTIIAAFLYLLLITPVIYSFGIYGMAVLGVVVSWYVVLSMYYYSKKAIDKTAF